VPRRETGPEAVYQFLVGMPAWVGPVCAIAAFALLRFLVPALLLANAEPKNPASVLGGVLGSVSATLAPWVAVFIVLIWLAAEWKKLVDRRRLESQTGLDSIRALSWSAFEELVTEYYRRAGYAVERTGSAAPDGGIDIVLRRDGLLTLVQCKHWKDRTVGVKVIRELCGVVTSRKAAAGVVVGSGSFTAEATAFARANQITLVGGDQLSQMVRSVQRNQPARSAIAPPAREGPALAGKAPACPRCGAPMVRRTARRGANAGSEFWGCTRYPACHGTRPH
jgi:restriction system protein